MPQSVRRFDIVGACLLVTLLMGVSLAAQSVGENYECSMSCHDDAQDIYESNLDAGMPDTIAREQAFADYMTCVFFC